MNRPWALLAVVGLLACATAGGLACSRSNMLAARPDGSAGQRGWDASADVQVSADVQIPFDVQVPADAASSDLAGRSSCGNGRLDPCEECDDGNSLDGDGCSKDCKLDGCAVCGGMCPGCPPRRGPSCGNGLVTSDEICDDGNAVSGDGCSGDCKTVESGYRCPMPGRRCLPICGDGLLVGWESLLPAEPSCDPADQSGASCRDGLATRYEECDLGDLNGVRLDREGKPSNHPDALVLCRTDCTIALPRI